MGDNRNESLDSRYEEVGNIEKSRIEGKAVFRLWPLSKFGTIKNGNATED
jgi:signal peptidase I